MIAVYLLSLLGCVLILLVCRVPEVKLLEPQASGLLICTACTKTVDIKDATEADLGLREVEHFLFSGCRGSLSVRPVLPPIIENHGRSRTHASFETLGAEYRPDDGVYILADNSRLSILEVMQDRQLALQMAHYAQERYRANHAYASAEGSVSLLQAKQINATVPMTRPLPIRQL